MKLNRENLLHIYCLFKNFNGKDKAMVYWQLTEVFGKKQFIENWEKLFKETGALKYFQGRTAVSVLPTLRLDDLERMAIVEALEQKGWSQKRAANSLGISARRLNYRIAYYEITHDSWRKNREPE